jgi:KipI family sensor histidine kinase inhibitor
MWRIDPCGDRALLVRLGNDIDPELLRLVLSLEQVLISSRPRGLLETLPAYASLLCNFDPTIASFTGLAEAIRRFEGKLQPVRLSGETVEIVTRYDGEDLANVAAATGLSRKAVIDLHTARDYLVYCVGFAPGFPYCGELDDRLSVPRRASPRSNVIAGSVAIAGRQTGIYPVASPGGWNIIGHTDVPLFDVKATPPARFKPGDRLRFVPG